MYLAKADRYDGMKYNYCGESGLKLPFLSLGMWYNFGFKENFENMGNMLMTAFDLGITHFDLANNYGPPPGSAETNFGRHLNMELGAYRDQIIVSSKAGYGMWEGPYGDFGSRKYLMASINQSLKRTGLEYFDIFYSHRPDTDTPIEETMGALADIVRQGKALYVGISNYNPDQTRAAVAELNRCGVRCLIHQHSYSMFNRTSERGLFDAINETGIGSIAFSPLAQGQLTDRYIQGIPTDSRIAKGYYLKKEDITEEKLNKIIMLNEIAKSRGIKLAQLALLWVMRRSEMTSVLIGASKPEQIIENAAIVKMPPLNADEQTEIDKILG
ncbi:MAG: L-glyceraldehyde 3-phosphate reductase [Clostridiales bacterium GWF2_38_85]|nr:MAG: L-glyceraldehyde 3-phosphate reductase [Clostridiales bacterium GWF2_38_85]HBL85350.1 L-glyceraldehyde 3-phosphate reductase [Clostridiales bacterium]